MDETQPLLRDDTCTAAERPHDTSDAGKGDIVDFDPNGDSENPMEWPKAYRWFIVFLLAFLAFTVTFTCISVVPIANRIVYDLDNGRFNKSASVLLVTIWELGEAVGPFFIAPLSEIWGRYPVLNAANALFIVATILAALCQSSPFFIAARALTGVAVAANVMNPAIVADIFASEERGSAMSFIMLAPLIGGAAGPAISGAIAQSSNWRNVVWMSTALAGACELAFLTCFRETYKVTILKRRAAKLRKETGNLSLRTRFDTDKKDTSAKKFWNSIMRPTTVFFGSGVLQALSLFGSATFAFFYIMSTTLPDILEGIYGLPPALTGSAFFCFSIGSGTTAVVCNIALDRIYVRLRDSHKGVGQPEYRLPLVIVGALVLPFMIALYGWIAQTRLPLPVMLVAVGMMGAALLLCYLPQMVYVADAFGIYSASGMTALIVTRCLMGTFLPLATTPLVQRLGYGFGFTVLGGVGLALAPIPILLLRYGSRWREGSSYSKGDQASVYL